MRQSTFTLARMRADYRALLNALVPVNALLPDSAL
jgi:hypothetical protein